MDNNVVLQRIIKFQTEPVFHQLTCGNDSRHEALIAVLTNNKIVLFCKECGYRQEKIPDFFYNEGFDTLYEEQRKMLESLK